ncbi:hypothetical protein GUJ93_ZPchr0004g40456 [Zizania palustris]|uniref:Uncharacterized protein n=1 Tax=Zizania palustris TaxID=103762 RepID=A0A8J5T1I8_ZIZPA|nr:hypothetical protein GUJ93_ZPchr0004g40456 [Zizania palustris]
MGRAILLVDCFSDVATCARPLAGSCSATPPPPVHRRPAPPRPAPPGTGHRLMWLVAPCARWSLLVLPLGEENTREWGTGGLSLLATIGFEFGWHNSVSTRN